MLMPQTRLPSVGVLLLVSLLAGLNLPLIFVGFTGMDQYGFFSLGLAAGWPLILAAAANVALSLLAYASYRAISELRPDTGFAARLYEIQGGLRRYALLFGPPVALAMLPSLLLTSYGAKPYFIFVGVGTAGFLGIAAALKDGQVRLHPEIARYWFISGAIALLLLLAVWIAGMLVLHYVSQIAPTGNFLWSWDFSWDSLGYPPEQFDQRQRTAFLAFTAAGAGCMTLIPIGLFLGPLSRRASATAMQDEAPQVRQGQPAVPEPPPPPPWPAPENLDGESPPDWADAVLSVLAGEHNQSSDEPDFVASLNGREIAISARQYEGLLADKERLLQEAGLLVDKASGTAFVNDVGNWKRIAFRGRLKGPFLLLCLYARHPGRRFTSSELESLLRMELPDRSDLNVSNFFAQLQKRQSPRVPVRRDAEGSYIPETVNICFLDNRPGVRPAMLTASDSTRL